jgi:hypothetical protein
MVELDSTTSTIEFPYKHVSGGDYTKIMSYVIEFLRILNKTEYVPIPKPLPTKYFDKQNVFTKFINDKSVIELSDIMDIADYMRIPQLIELACAKKADYFRNKTKEEIEAMYNL